MKIFHVPPRLLIFREIAHAFHAKARHNIRQGIFRIAMFQNIFRDIPQHLHVIFRSKIMPIFGVIPHVVAQTFVLGICSARVPIMPDALFLNFRPVQFANFRQHFFLLGFSVWIPPSRATFFQLFTTQGAIIFQLVHSAYAPDYSDIRVRGLATRRTIEFFSVYRDAMDIPKIPPARAKFQVRAIVRHFWIFRLEFFPCLVECFRKFPLADFHSETSAFFCALHGEQSEFSVPITQGA